LTNEEAKNNYELYGNPDGPGSMRISIGLPSSFILDKEKHNKILIAFIIIVSVIIPYYFYNWISVSRLFDSGGLLIITRTYFMKNTNINSEIKHIPFILGSCHEFGWIQDDKIEETRNEINELYNKYKGEMPEIQHEKYDKILSLKNKKAIAIAYAYTYGDLNDKNYLKLKNVNKYIILLAKLLDAFFDSHNSKNLLYNVCQMNGGDPNQIEFPRVSRTFMHSILSYQQCFYQGIPIQKREENISYIQLPHININNFHLITESSENTKFRTFLKKNDEDKKIFLKKIFNFSDNQINEIIAVSHSIPQYEYKLKKYVEGYEDTDIVFGDILTYKIIITRKNVGRLSLGISHSKCFPGLFNECIYITVLIGDTIIKQEKVLIDKKVTEFIFPIKITVIGKNTIKFSMIPASFFGQNEMLEGSFECVQKSNRRKMLLDSIKKRKVKLPISYLEQFMKEQGFKIGHDSDEDEEEEEEVEDNHQNKDEKEKVEEKNK
jgi:translocation protein SEC63